MICLTSPSNRKNIRINKLLRLVNQKSPTILLNIIFTCVGRASAEMTYYHIYNVIIGKQSNKSQIFISTLTTFNRHFPLRNCTKSFFILAKALKNILLLDLKVLEVHTRGVK